MFDKSIVALRSSMLWIAVVSMFLSLLLPMMAGNTNVGAAQILDRSITMSTSAVSVETDYALSFQLPGGTVVGSMRIEFCDTDPLPNQTCAGFTEGTDVPSLDADTGSGISITSIAFEDTAGDYTGGQEANCTAPGLGTSHGAGSNLNYFDVVCDQTDNVTDFAETVVAGTGANDTDYVNILLANPNNPSSVGQFYARLYTYSEDGAVGDTNTPMATYVVGGNPLGTAEGGVALSTADQITVEARVQERLTFTVGGDTDVGDCGTISGTTVELGVLDGTEATINRASVDTIGSNTDLICTEVTTNAANGVAISYLATPLGVGTCNTQANEDIDAATELETDACLNWDDTGGTTFTQGVEGWGIGVISTPANGAGATNNLGSIPAKYDQTGGWSDDFVVEPYIGSAVELANSGGNVVAGESLEIDVGAEAAITTPTGLYTATLTFIATSSF